MLVTGLRRFCAYALAGSRLRPIMLAWVALCFLLRSTPLFALPGDPDWIFVSPEERRAVERIQALDHLCEYDQAVGLAEEAAQQFPNSVEVHQARLQLARSMNRVEDVLPEYVARAEQDPDDVTARFCVALGYLSARNPAAAREEVEAVLALQPDLVQARHLQVIVARNLPDLEDEAGGLAERLLEEFPDYSRAYITQVEYLLHQRASTRRIQALLSTALALPTPPADAFDLQDRLNRRELWYDPATALPLYDKALAVDPSRVDLAVSRALRRRDLGETKQALDDLQAMVRQAPRFGQGRYSLARCLLDLHGYDDALQVLQEGFELVRHQDWYEPYARRLRAYAFHRSGRRSEAIEELNSLLEAFRGHSLASDARETLLLLLAQRETDRIRVLPEVPFLAQKGNYCGPATLSMALGYWGLELDQDRIAAEIYTGVVGTAPQVIREFATTRGLRSASFDGTVNNWKRLLDAGVPVLWLTKAPRGNGGHYILIVGYDDVFREFVVHNPHQAAERTVPYSDLDARGWLRRALTRSIAFVPTNDPRAAMLEELKGTPLLNAFNLVFYLTTGSNLFRGLWPALAVNLAGVLLIVSLVLLLFRSLTFPAVRWSGVVFLAGNLALVAALNVWIASEKSSVAVSLLTAYYLSFATLVVLLALVAALRRISHDWFRPFELYSLALAVFVSWSARGILDDGLWSDRLPVVFLAAVFGVLAGNRWRLARAIASARGGPVLSPGKPGRMPSGSASRSSQFYSWNMAIVESTLGSLEGEEARRNLSRIRAARPCWSRSVVNSLTLMEAASFIFEKPSTEHSSMSPVQDQADHGIHLLETLIERAPADGPPGAAARALLAYAMMERYSFAAPPAPGAAPRHPLNAEEENARSRPPEASPDPLERIRALASASDAYFSSLRFWPRLPGVPRAGFSKAPHLLVRLVPLLLRQVAEGLSRVGRGTPDTASSGRAADAEVSRIGSALTALLEERPYRVTPLQEVLAESEIPDTAQPGSEFMKPAVQPLLSKAEQSLAGQLGASARNSSDI